VYLQVRRGDATVGDGRITSAESPLEGGAGDAGDVAEAQGLAHDLLVVADDRLEPRADVDRLLGESGEGEGAREEIVADAAMGRLRSRSAVDFVGEGEKVVAGVEFFGGAHAG